MRKFYILFAAAFAATTMSAGPVFSPIKAKSLKNGAKCKIQKMRPARKFQKAEATTTIWRPGTQILSEWDPESEEWMYSAKYETTYDGVGRILTDLVTPLDLDGTPYEDEPAQRTTYVYNEFGMPTSQLIEESDENGFTNYSKKIREYDPQAHNVIVANTESMWWDDEWVDMGNCYRREVTRNSLGNVTEVTIKVLYEGEYEATQKMTVEYGDDNKANRILTSELTYDEDGNLYWQDQIEYKDIVWHHTNGQILTEDGITTAENGIASCTVMDNDGENHVTVDYPNDKGSFHSMLTYENGSVEVKYSVVDDYGSYNYMSTEIYKEEGEEDYTYTETELYRKNEYGLETEIFMSAQENDEPIMVMEHTKGEIEQNLEYGYPETFTVQSFDPETEEYSYIYKVDFSNYTDVTGVKGITADKSAPAEYYTIDGRRTNATAPGIYILRQGKKATKIVK